MEIVRSSEGNHVALRPELLAKLANEAERRRTNVEALVNEWLEEYLWEQRHKKIQEEAERYQAAHSQLRVQYAEKVIAFHEGQVVDSGEELQEVYQRVRQKFGDEPVLITRVGPDPVETYSVRSPRLAELTVH